MDKKAKLEDIEFTKNELNKFKKIGNKMYIKIGSIDGIL